MAATPTASALMAELDRHRIAMPERRLTDARGFVWRWRDNGRERPVLLLLPGAGGSGDAAFRLADALNRDLRVITITYPSDASADELADGLADLMGHLHCTSAHVWASSYAAWWIQAFAMRHPELPSGLWLGNGLLDGADVAGLPLFDLDRLLSQTAQQVQAAWVAAALQRPPGDLRDLLLEMLSHSLTPEELRSRFIRVASAPAIPVRASVLTCPVVVAHCEDDPIIRAPTHERSRMAWGGACHVLLPAGGHYPHVTHIDLLLPPMREWLQISRQP